MTFVSFAQNLEDVVLWRALKGVAQGFYIDAGANDPHEDSITKAFYERGWHGVNIEPLASHWTDLARERPRDINLRCAAGNAPGELELWEGDVRGWATLDPQVIAKHQATGHNGVLHKVPVRTLTDICTEHATGNIHFLKIDVEGFEKTVLEGMDFQRFRPWILVIEAIAPNSTVEDHQQWESLVLTANYVFAYADGLNRFYVAQEHSHLLDKLRYPPNVLDGFVRAAEKQAHAEAQQARAEAQQARAEAQQVRAEIESMLKSRSWRITAPMRWGALQIRRLREQGLKSRSKALLKKLTRPAQKAFADWKHTLKLAAMKPIFFLHPLIARNRFLKAMALRVLNRFPAIKQKMQVALVRRRFVHISNPSATRTSALSPLADGILGKDIVRDNQRVVLLYVEHTASFDRITGVQRVCHKLAPMLESNGEMVVLIKLDPTTLRLAPLDASERQNFLKQAGFGSFGNDRLHDPAVFEGMLTALQDHPRKHWLIIPEVTYHTHHANPPTSRLIKLARDFSMRVGVIYYDIIPFLTEDAGENARNHADYTSTIALADVIWPISRYSAEHLIDYYKRYDKIDDADMPAISVAVLAEEMDTPRRIDRDSDNDRSIVCVGTIDERKNQITLIKAFNRYCASHQDTRWKLKIVGMVRENYRKIIERETSQNPNIELHYGASDEDIKQFYVNSDFTVFPSLEEGFGLPIVESLWNIKPCICANFSSMAELHANGGCVAADTQSVDALLSAITALIEDESLYRAKIDEIMRRPVKSWFEYAGGLCADMDKLQFGKPAEGPIYYWVDATLAASSNTGIQRVTRQLAKHLMKQGHRLVPIKWDEHSNSIVLASRKDLDYLAHWNGPEPDSWGQSFASTQIEAEAAYLMVELPLNRPLEIQERVLTFFKERAVRCAAVFYDAIPYKLSALYPPHFASAHMDYMELLDRMDFILPISGTSARDFIDYLGTSACRGLSIETRVKTVALPFEFPEARATTRETAFDADKPCNILAVGTVEPRKNHETLIRAFFEAEKKSTRKLRLTIVGGDESFDKDLPGKITALIGNSKSITWIKKATDALLKEQFEQADFTVFPSFEEGFGMPIVESLWFDVPCICSASGQMGELAAHGGCETIDVRSVEDMSNAIVRLANDPDRAKQLKDEILDCHFKTWDEYAAEISACIRAANLKPNSNSRLQTPPIASYELPAQPTISICITTYNRADWLAVNLENLMRVSQAVRDKIEIIVCDNCSEDKTPEIAARFFTHKNFFYYRNTANIGMLGNLPQTVAHARGAYVWLLGDDDLLHQGALERVLGVIEKDAPDLINVNYAYTPEPVPPSIDKLDRYFAAALKISQGDASGPGKVQDISAFNENFYTAIYTFVVKRKHAQKIFNQDTSGAPFSNLQTCVPSSKYILSYMMDLPGYWINEPQITINMNVSWGKYAPLWILERLPEVYDLAELKGVAQEQADRWRRHTLQMVPGFFKILFESEYDLSSFASFDVTRFIRRSRHLNEFRTLYPQLETIYAKAQGQNHPLAKTSMDILKAAMQ
ncbi:FkbM family methyltransferase [Hylemonella gracilis]|uniref:Glycosyltransferase n=1 Tax=Hylemonella gracilis ATCC 19624 TaxID=887062 RepID=F3KSE7_9BURK|nr:FkbM family methyltransferase [Hylemonella gracilis]EGI77341.1 glycosyltransferase [Hylemonella gracilis ATCC 19624]